MLERLRKEGFEVRDGDAWSPKRRTGATRTFLFSRVCFIQNALGSPDDGTLLRVYLYNPQMETSVEIVEVLQRLVKLMVKQPDQVTVELSRESTNLILRLRVAPEELGKVIGKQGKTARSLRQILEAIAMTTNVRIKLDIDDNDGSKP